MPWSDQSIEEAIQTAKTRNAIFVVYVEDDTKPTPLHSIIESPEVSALLMNERFVAIRIRSSDQSYRDFVAICHNGWPLEIISGELPQAAVIQRIQNILGQSDENIGGSSSTESRELSVLNAPEDSPSSTCVSATTSATSTSVPQEPETSGDVRENVDTNSSDPETSSGVSGSTRSDGWNLPSPDDKAPSKNCNQNIPLSDPISAAGVSESSSFKKQEQKKSAVQSSSSENKPATNPSSSSIRDIPRPQPRRIQEDSKSRLLSSEERARHPLGRVPSVPHPHVSPSFLASIRGWMQRFLQSGRGGVTTGRKTGHLLNEGGSESLGVTGASSRSRIYEPSTRLSGDPGFAHIQFRLPDGSTHSTTFPTQTTIRGVREYVQNNIPLPFRDFGLSTSYPRIEFTDEQIDATIAELGLVPRSVILIIPGTETARPVLSSASGALWAVVTWPFSAVFSVVNYINFFLYGEPQAEISDQSASQQQPRTSQLPTRNQNPSDRNQSNVRRRIPSSSVVQREGNVYRLSNRQDDSEDENNTWNGNSTQQM
ncbi:UBX domain-containing protein 4 [Gryllus bimaculatus]|nr:UBX domain-containing protein 4 [Gryllus bimaculatus]